MHASRMTGPTLRMAASLRLCSFLNSLCQKDVMTCAATRAIIHAMNTACPPACSSS